MITFITPTIRQENINNVFENYNRQLVENKELIVILNKDGMDLNSWLTHSQRYKNVRIIQLPEERSLGECLNEGIQLARFNYIAKFDDDDYYGPDYANTALIDLQNNRADVVGKSSIFVYYEDSRLLTILNPGYENLLSTNPKLPERLLSGATLVFKKDVSLSVPFPNINIGEDSSFQLECLRMGYVLYSSDRYNYYCVRKANKYFHTSVVSNERLIKKSKIISKTGTPESYVNKKEI
ncbi:glycosyltransferase [Sutcliffiella horikoshii]|uniref:glycosyltransferase n=1 Tax=Sutcliffiella horikoshii TaxID=79883 RepID=UPI001F46E8A7|nr:glycosyltransferase [Sutcliffiella horikoshii]